MQVAASLFQWLSRLPAPIIPCKLYTRFLRLQRQCNDHADKLLQLHFLFCQVRQDSGETVPAEVADSALNGSSLHNSNSPRATLQMEVCELELLNQLTEFLHEYQRSLSIDGLCPPSLGRVFGAIFLRAQEGPLPLPFPEDVRTVANFVDFLITDFPAVFAQPTSLAKSPSKPPSRYAANLHAAELWRRAR